MNNRNPWTDAPLEKTEEKITRLWTPQKTLPLDERLFCPAVALSYP
jgi:hypothetical protein